MWYNRGWAWKAMSEAVYSDQMEETIPMTTKWHFSLPKIEWQYRAGQ